MGVDTFKALAVKELHVNRIYGENTTTPVFVGAGNSSHTLNSENDLLVSGELEVIGNSFFDGNLTVTDNVYLVFGNSDDTGIRFTTGQTIDTLQLNLDVTSKTLLVCDIADTGVDFGHGGQADPTIFIQSGDGTNTADWVSIAHDQTDGVIDCGAGTLNLGATGNVNFAGASKTGTGDTAIDGYVTMEVAGAAVKFATVA